jgi:hypothetical protein
MLIGLRALARLVWKAVVQANGREKGTITNVLTVIQYICVAHNHLTASNCLQIKIYIEHESNKLPDARSASDEEVKADFDMSVQLRQDYPGLCAFDFQQITELMIKHILGWDRINQVSYSNGGAFGVLEAWNTAIEEQGRKMLHSHWILYVKEWSTSLLRGLYSNDERKRSRAATELRTYVDSIISTKLFGLDENLVQKAYKHQCHVRHPPHCPIFVRIKISGI